MHDRQVADNESMFEATWNTEMHGVRSPGGCYGDAAGQAICPRWEKHFTFPTRQPRRGWGPGLGSLFRLESHCSLSRLSLTDERPGQDAGERSRSLEDLVSL